MTIEKINVVIVLAGDGPENERSRIHSFLAPEKIAALRDDPGALGALLEDHARSLRAEDDTGRIGPKR